MLSLGGTMCALGALFGLYSAQVEGPTKFVMLLINYALTLTGAYLIGLAHAALKGTK